MESGQEEKFSSQKFSQEAHPRKSDMQQAPQPNTGGQMKSDVNQSRKGGPGDDDMMSGMLLPDPGAHDNQLYSGCNHCCGAFCMW